MGTVEDTYTKSLLHFSGADGSTVFTDETGKAWWAGDTAQIDTAQYKFGLSSVFFDGGDYISTATGTDWQVGSGDFTIDLWFRLNSTTGTRYLFGNTNFSGDPNNTSYGIALNSSSVLNGVLYIGGVAYTTLSNSAYTDSNWHHYAMVRSGTTLMSFVDGTKQTSTATVSGSPANPSSNISLGRFGDYGAGLYYNGWIDEFRFSKGIARWTDSFTPQTIPYASRTKNYLQERIRDHTSMRPISLGRS